ncbi:MAG TPA: hypothetical protein VIU12_08415 [Chryseolinea sp.]
MKKRISLIHQAGALRSYFPSSNITRKGERELIWVGELTPTPLSDTYKIKLHFLDGEFIRINVLAPVLRLAPTATGLPHVYSTEKQELCLYYPKDNEWDPSMYYVRTLIPWASEWLYHYEVWLATGGVWHGGGIDHNGNEETKQQVAALLN